jgi:hypothetical protein
MGHTHEEFMSREVRYDKAEVAWRGTEIYQSTIKPQLSQEDKGRFVAVDVETETFEIAKTMRIACERLRERCPDAQIWGVRVGYVAVRGFGRIPEES